MADEEQIVTSVPGAHIVVAGVGGGGNNTISRISRAGVQGIHLVAINTDAQALQTCPAGVTRLPIGVALTGGLGAGGRPDIGKQAAETSQHEIAEVLSGADLVFVTAGMGGGTGTGAAPVVARLAQEAGALTVAFVTRPFRYEGPIKARHAQEGIEALRANVDAVIVIPNDRLLKIADPKMTLVEAFRKADDILRQGIQGITDIITIPGLINVDFADIRAILSQSGTALMAIGHGTGPRRCFDAAERAVRSELLEVSIRGAQRALVNISGGSDLSLAEVSEAAEYIHSQVAADAQIIFGAVLQDLPEDNVQITVIATLLPAESVEPPSSTSAPVNVSPRPTQVPSWLQPR
ncbi:MAG: cell division protein FtsZ [Chloroflexi bacterium]|nr:cell division protein FtsZ [Chloroflexota bacterium]